MLSYRGDMPLLSRLGTATALLVWLALVTAAGFDLVTSNHLGLFAFLVAASSTVTFPLLERLGAPPAREDVRP
jgi:hypothetical protein